MPMDWEKLELELINFRKRLHKFPELSGNEKVTANRVVDFARRFYHGEIITKLGGNGVAIVFKGEQAGKTVLIPAIPVGATTTVFLCVVWIISRKSVVFPVPAFPVRKTERCV